MAAPISTTYSQEEREAIMEHVLAELSGGRAVSRILREDEGMPAASQFWKWHFEDPELQDKVARARENGVESLMDETLVIADTQELGVRVKISDDGKEERTEEDMLGHRKLKIETRYKYAQMIAPRKYGQKIDLTSNGERVRMSSQEAAMVAASLVDEWQRRKQAQLEHKGGDDE